MIKMRKEIIISILIMFLITLSSCSRQVEQTEENLNLCSDDLECPSYGCEIGKCVQGACQFSTKSNCCGNGICESSENTCSCPNDCGKCESQGVFIRSCKDNKCVTNVDVNSLSSEIKYMDLNIASKAYLKLKFDYNQPSIIDGSNIMIDFILETLNDYNSIKINKISLDALVDGDLLYLGNYQREFSLNNVNKQYKVYFVPNFLESKDEYEVKSIDLNIWYELEEGVENTLTIRTPIEKIEIEKVESSVTCPNACNDNNILTKDECSTSTNNRCIYEYRKEICGNYICESGENSCNCPFDCAECETAFDIEGVEGVCNNETEQCEPSFSGIVTENPIVEDRNIAGFTMQIKYNFENPAINESSLIKITSKLDNLADGWDDIEFEQINVLSGDKLLGTSEFDSSNKLNSVGDEEVLYTYWTYNGEIDINLPIKLKVYYITTNDEDVETRGSFEKSIGTIRRIDFSKLI